MESMELSTLFTVTLLAASLTLPQVAEAHSGHARSSEVEIAHEVALSPGRVEVRQTQAYTGKMALALFAEVDSDGDGKLSEAERAAGAKDGARQYAEAVELLVDWLPAESLGVTATFLKLPQTRPADGGPPAEAVTLVHASYRFAAGAGMRPLSLGLGQLNANRITGGIEASGQLRIARANCGTVAPQSVREMVATAGSPDSFQILFTTDDAPGGARGGGGVPPAAAAAAAVVLFLAGVGIGRSQAPTAQASGGPSDES